MIPIKEKVTIFILACHRSGTEMVSDCLHNGGVLMGDVELLAGNNFTVPRFARWVLENGTVEGQNPLLNGKITGFGQKVMLKEYLKFPEDSYSVGTDKPREDRRLTYLNNSMLTFSGYSWDKPGVVGVEQINNNKYSEVVGNVLKKLSRTLINEYNNDGRMWGLKDPRTLFTFDFWEKQFQNIENNLKLIFIYRNPMSVAKGLRFQGTDKPLKDWPLKKGIKLWEAYNEQVLKLMDKPYDKIVLKYEEFISGNDEVEMLDDFLCLNGRLKNPFNPDLCHYNPIDVPPECNDLYERLETKRMEINSAALKNITEAQPA